MTLQDKSKKTMTLLDKELPVARNLFALFTAAILTGFATYLLPGHDSWHQWTYLVHSLVGVVLALIALPYTFSHVKRTVGVRKPMVILVGSLSLLSLFGLIGTGIYIIIFGQLEALAWIFQSHIVLGVVIILMVLIHIILYMSSLNKQRRGKKSTKFPTLTLSLFRNTLIVNVVILLIITGASIGYNAIPLSYQDKTMIEPYELSYGEHPFRPSQTETSVEGHFVDARRIAGSDDCGSCHEAITRQWMASMHRQAANDQSYVSNVSLLSEKKGITTTRYCEGCHAPVALLTGQLTPGGQHGGVSGTLANAEGISCMACHGIHKIAHLKGVASYEFTPKNDYLFADREGLIFKKIRNFLIRIHPQQHKLDLAPPILSDSSMCATCHAQFMDKDVNKWGWVKMQDEYSAWLASPYSGQSDQTFSHENVKRCQDCHFPLITANDPSANKDGQVRSHFSLGSNTAIPWYTGDEAQLKRTREFLQANKININIELPTRLDATQTDLLIRNEITQYAETPSYFYLGETAKIRMTVTNNQVGHDFPGGTIDINEAWLHFRVTDTQNKVIFESGAMESDATVDAKAHFYRAIAIDRHGNEVWKHDLFNMIGERNRNVIKARGTDIVDYQFKIPGWAKGPLSMTAVLRYRKFNMKYAKWALKQETLDLPIVDVAKDTINIPLRNKRPIE